MASAGGDPAALPNALTEGFQVAFLAGAGFALAGLIATLVLIRNRDSRAHVELAAETTAGGGASAERTATGGAPA